MANTTNYNWETPDDTDLVKDGAAAIRTLGNSIDTTTKNLNPETTTGDIAYRSATANTNTRLAIGSTGQVLTVAAGVPSWATPTVGDITEVQAGTGISVADGTGPIPIVTNTVATEFDAKGDLVVGTGADTFDRLAVGTDGYTLVADSSVSPQGLKWAVDPVADVVTTAGDLLYATAADTVTRLGIGTASQVLAVNSGATAPEWVTPAGGGANEALGYKYAMWNPTNTTGTRTDASSSGTSSGNTTNISASNSSGTLTLTLAATGFYLVSVNVNSNIQSTYTSMDIQATVGGTATLYLDTTSPLSAWGDPDEDGNIIVSNTFIVNAASANQTVTILPAARLNGGVGGTSLYDFYANVAIVRM